MSLYIHGFGRCYCCYTNTCLGRILAIVWPPLGQHKNMEFSNKPQKSKEHMKNQIRDMVNSNENLTEQMITPNDS